jgi:5'-nucleotidase
MLRPEWGIDIIIGGHSHTILDKPRVVNNVLIVQAGVGSDQIGRFDIVVDDDTNSIVEYKWQLIPIDEDLAEPDQMLQDYIVKFQSEIDRKYNTVICKLAIKLTHPQREQETSLGNLVADAFGEVAACDVVLVGSGSIRRNELGPLVTLKDLRSCFPYDDTLTRYTITGAQLKKVFSYIMRPENRNSEGECYQVNTNVKAVYRDVTRKLVSLQISGKKVRNDRMYTICFQGYHFNNAPANLNLTQEELLQAGNSKVITTSAKEVLEEYLRNHQNIKRKIEGRLTYYTTSDA